METKPADSTVVDKKDNRYTRHSNITTTWQDAAIDYMKKIKLSK